MYDNFPDEADVVQQVSKNIELPVLYRLGKDGDKSLQEREVLCDHLSFTPFNHLAI